MSRPALFVDRDGTIIVEREYLSDPGQVALIPGAADALRAFADAGYLLVVVTNQSGIARGMYSEADYDAVTARLRELLAAEGVRLDAIYHCPHHPDFGGPCTCRKPLTGLYTRAAADHDIDLAASIYVGDRRRDTDAALELGGRGFLVRTGHGATEPVAPPIEAVDDLRAVAARVLQLDTHAGRE